jgi:hypothetical protein
VAPAAPGECGRSSGAHLVQELAEQGGSRLASVNTPHKGLLNRLPELPEDGVEITLFKMVSVPAVAVMH